MVWCLNMIFAWMWPSLVLFSTGTVFYHLDPEVSEVSAVARIAHDTVWPLVSKWLVSYLTHCLYRWNSPVLWHVACMPVIITHFLKEFGAPSSNFNKFLVPYVCWWIGWMGGGAQDDFSQTVQFLWAQHQEELTLNSYPWLFFCELINAEVESWSCVSCIQHWFSPGGFVNLAPFTGLSYCYLKCKQVET